MELTQRLPRIFPLKTGVIIFSLITLVAGILKITRVESPIEALLGENITIPCHFYGYETSPLDLTIVSVRWTMETSEIKEKQVYFFDGTHHIAERPGSHILHSGLMGGNGDLHLPNLQFSDDGKYTCTVFVTPDKAINKVTLQVSAKPTCTVSDSRLVMNPDTVKSVTCYVNGFHPEAVKIEWVKYSTYPKKSEVNSEICTTVPVLSHDGTYNVTNILSVKPKSTEEDGDVYSCVITHRSLKDGLTCNVTLKVQGKSASEAWILTGILLTVLISLLAGLCLCYKCIEVSPTVLEITKEDLFHMKESTLEYHILGFRSRKITVKLYLENDTDKKTEVCSYCSESPRNILPEANPEENVPLQNMNNPTNLSLDLKITKHKFVFFNCICYIHITPKIKIHNGAVLTLEVLHAALKSPIQKYQILKVKVKPQMNQIKPNKTSYKAGEQMELTCNIKSFYPKSMKVLWFKETQEISSENIEEGGDENGLNNMRSYVKHTVTEEDFGKTFRCNVKYLPNTSKFVKWKLEKLVEPILDPFPTNQESYKVGDQFELKCRIHSFCPQKIKVTWWKEDEVIQSQNSEPEYNENTSSDAISWTNCTVEENDFGKTFTCKVEHKCKNKQFQWRLEKTGNISIINSM